VKIPLQTQPSIAVVSMGQMNERQEEIASALPAELDALPRLGGFRLRGMQMTRLETFIDAAFAFAITMLVIAAQQIPDDIETLLAAFKNVPAFVASVIVLGIFWRGHWLWSRRYGLGAHSESQMRSLFAVFALGFTAIALEVVLLNLRAWQLRKPLRLNAREKLITLYEVTGWSVPVGVGIISLVLALTLPREQIQWSGWVYFSMVILVPLHSAYRRRRMEQKEEGRSKT